PKCPPVIDTASISSARSSSATWRKSASGSLRRSAGTLIVSSNGVRFEMRGGVCSTLRSSTTAANDKTRHLSPKFRSLFEQIKMGHRLAHQQLGLGARPFDAKYGNKRRFPGRRVRADRLPGLLGRALDIEQVVGDLEGEAEIVRIAAQCRAQLVRRL